MTQYRFELLARILQSNVCPGAISPNALQRAKSFNDLRLDPLAGLLSISYPPRRNVCPEPQEPAHGGSGTGQKELGFPWHGLPPVILGREQLRRLLQLLVLRLGFLQDGDVGVGVFPEGKEVLIGCFRFGDVAR